MIDSTSAADSHARRKEHDLNEAIQTFKLAIENIDEGYRFDDAYAERKIKQLKKSFKILKEFLNKNRAVTHLRGD